MTNAFYTELPTLRDFTALSDDACFQPLPQDWWIGTSDIKGSTRAVEEGKYKTVNMVAAAVISAQINTHEGAAFPFIFGGDGASFAVPPEWQDRARRALASVRAWARDAFEMDLRIGMVPVDRVRAAGVDVKVARFQVSDGVDYAMFAGGGILWAETQMKLGMNSVPADGTHMPPDLTGLSCRWSHMPSKHGAILSVVVMQNEQAAPDRYTGFITQLLGLTQHLDAHGHPSEKEGPGVSWPPTGATLEAHAQRGPGSLSKARRKALFESLVAWVLIKTGLKLGGFDARRYRRVVGDNADFRKFEDGLKMTLDCDKDTETKLRALLTQGAKDGLIKYGLHAQSEAMMTCIVPSILEDNHDHFVDGAAGGYTAAAAAMKGQSA